MEERKKNPKELREEELDRFWDIDALIPRKKMAPPSVDMPLSMLCVTSFAPCANT